jgi:hypothetical protein
MCTVLLPPGDNPIAVNKYINALFIHTKQNLWAEYRSFLCSTWQHVRQLDLKRLIKHENIKALGGVVVELHAFFKLTQD